MANMDEAERFIEVLDGYSERAKELLAAWTPFLNDLSTKLSTGPYGPKDAAADFPEAARLALTSLIALGSEAGDAVAIMTLGFDETETVDGLKFSKAPTVRTLTAKADFKSVTGETLPTSHITFEPDHLEPDETECELRADGNGIKARTYDGWVVATDPNGGTSEAPATVTIG